MLTKKQIQEIKPSDFVPQFSYTRFKNGQIVPVTHAAFSPPRPKKEWDNQKKQYVHKMARG